MKGALAGLEVELGFMEQHKDGILSCTQMEGKCFFHTFFMTMVLVLQKREFVGHVPNSEKGMMVG